MPISDPFGLPLTELLDVGEPPPIQPVPAGAGTVFWRGQRGGTGALLTGIAAPTGVELWRWRMDPATSTLAKPTPPARANSSACCAVS